MHDGPDRLGWMFVGPNSFSFHAQAYAEYIYHNNVNLPRRIAVYNNQFQTEANELDEEN